jgi:predicted PhzF superfamily epimerase YddE/YHI9
VRYFSPACAVPFCGHPAIALGAALARREGDGVFALSPNAADITVEGRRDGARVAAALHSPPTWSRPADPGLVADALLLFGYHGADLDRQIPPGLAHAGANHLVPALASRDLLAGYLRDLGWPHGGAIDVVQGEDIGMRSLLHVEIGATPGGSIRVGVMAR